VTHDEQRVLEQLTETESAPTIPEELLNLAEDQRYITYDDILEHMPNAEEQLDLLEELFAQLHERNIQVWDEKPQEKQASKKRAVSEAADLSDVPISDPTDLYFREMGREPLLTAEEEVMLAKAVLRGGEAEEGEAEERLSKGRYLSPKTITRLEKAAEEGEAARRRLIRANTRLVISVAKRYVGQGVPFLDLVQEGNLGLMKAVDKFDYTRGFKFSTYATWWIRQAVSRAVSDQGRTIRLPVHIGDKLRLLHRASRELEQDQGRPASPEEDDAGQLHRRRRGPASTFDGRQRHPSREAGRHPGDSTTAGSADSATALWPARWPQLHTGGGRTEVWPHPRAHPSD
jgi:RNA polymerase primary sigma factor